MKTSGKTIDDALNKVIEGIGQDNVLFIQAISKIDPRLAITLSLALGYLLGRGHNIDELDDELEASDEH